MLKQFNGKTIINIAFEDGNATNRSLHFIFSDGYKAHLYHEKECTLVSTGDYSKLLNTELLEVKVVEKELKKDKQNDKKIVTTISLKTEKGAVILYFYSATMISVRITE